MKRLFGQKARSSKPSQVNPIPTPIPVDEFARAAQQHQKVTSQDDHWMVVPDQAQGATGPILQERSRSTSFTSLPPGATTPSPSVPGTNDALYQHSVHPVPYDGTPQPSNNNLLTPNSNHNHSQALKKSSTIHGASVILRSLDPEQLNVEGSISPSQESLQLNGETERERDPRTAERDYEAERERERPREWGRSREKEREREREGGRERVREQKRDSERDRYQERDQDRGRDRDKDRDRPKERRKGLWGASRDKEKERERSEQAELTRMIGKFLFRSSETQVQTIRLRLFNGNCI